MDNAEVAAIFEEVADLLEIENETPFRVRAYRASARTIQTLGEVRRLPRIEQPEGTDELPGIGKDLAGKSVRTGELALLKEPGSLATMMRVSNVGPKRARILYDGLGIRRSTNARSQPVSAACAGCTGSARRWRPRFCAAAVTRRSARGAGASLMRSSELRRSSSTFGLRTTWRPSR